MRKALFAAVAVAALGVLAVAPAQAHASWLSEAIHARLDPVYYPYYPAYDYGYPPVYDYNYYYAPGYDYVPWGGSVYYTTPYYVPYRSYYWWGGPAYYGGWYGHRGWHHGGYRAWHGGYHRHWR